MTEEKKPTVTLNPFELVKAGIFPLHEKIVRFAVGDPDGLSSNAWRVWMQGPGDIYLACRDSFHETKVSLHISGRWRFGFTKEAINARPDLLREGTDRAMEVWDKPPEFALGITQAFKLFFPFSGLHIRKEQRSGKKWQNVLYIEAGNLNICTVLAVYVTKSDKPFSYNNIRSFCLGMWRLPDGTFAQLVAQAEPINIEDELDEWVKAGRLKAQQDGFTMPDQPIFQFWGVDSTTGARFTVILPDRQLR